MTAPAHARVEGTLILATLFRGGVLIAADRGGLAEDTVLTSQEKLFRLSDNLIYAVCGGARITFRNDLTRDVFNAATITRDYFASSEPQDAGAFFKGLAERLKSEFHAYLASLRFEHWPEHTENRHREYFRVVFFFRDDAERIWLTELSFRYTKEQPPKLSVATFTGWYEGLFFAYGYTAVTNGLIRKEAALDDLAADPRIALFLRNDVSPSDITRDQALEFSRLMMKASSERNPPTHHVSADFCYLVLDGKLLYGASS